MTRKECLIKEFVNEELFICLNSILSNQYEYSYIILEISESLIPFLKVDNAHINPYYIYINIFDVVQKIELLKFIVEILVPNNIYRNYINRLYYEIKFIINTNIRCRKIEYIESNKRLSERIDEYINLWNIHKNNL